MPRAVDPGLFGMQLPVDHSPLNRIPYNNRATEFDLEAFLQQVEKFITDFLFPVIEDLTGLDLSMFLPMFESLDLSDPVAFFTSLAEMLLSMSSTLLGFGSPLNLLNAFNLLPPNLLGLIPHSSIGEAPQANLVTDPDFADTSVIDGWPHDPTGGFGGTGTRYVVADGATHELLGNLINASVGQVMSVKGKSKWTSLVGTGNPISLAVTGYAPDGTALDQSTLAVHSTAPTTTDWLDLAGTYTVPTGVTGVRTRLVVGSGATGGTVYFSKISAFKTQSMFQRLIAGTNAGEFLPDDISHLFGGIIQNTLDIVNKVAQGDFDDLISTIGGPVGDTITAVEERLNDFLNGLSPLNGDNISSGNIIDDVIPGIGTIINNIFGSLFGLGGVTGATHDDAASALQANAHALTDHGAGITNMFARLSNLESKVSALPVAGGGTGQGTADGGAVGVTDTDTFERQSSTSLGPLWLQTYKGPGVWATKNGHDAEFTSTGLADCSFLAIRNNPAILRSQTDYQRVTMELSSRSSRLNDPVFGVYDFNSYDDIWLRVADEVGGVPTTLDNITGIRMRWGGNGTLSIYRFVGGAGTLLKELTVSQRIVPPGPGANLIGEAGVLVDNAPRVFRAKIGASIRLEVTETGTASALGPAARRWGHGGRGEASVVPLPGVQIPGGAHYWNGMDQTR